METSRFPSSNNATSSTSSTSSSALTAIATVCIRLVCACVVCVSMLDLHHVPRPTTHPPAPSVFLTKAFFVLPPAPLVFSN